MNSTLLSLSLLVLAGATTDTQANSNDVSQYLSTIIVPKPVKRIAPKYPVSAARQGREGWTILSFVIGENGDVSDALVKESSGSADFDKAALKAASQWKYQPAFENGKAIQQCVNTVQMDFKMGKSGSGEKRVSRRFNRKYKVAVQAMKDKDYPVVELQLAEMKKIKNMHLSENNYMHLIAAEYAKAIDDAALQLYHLNRIHINTKTSDEKLAFSVLYQRFYLEATLSKFPSALSTYKRLIKLELAQPYLAKLEQTMTEVDSIISSNKDIVINAAIESEYWYADLVRNEFSLTNIEGSLHTLDVRCANKRHIYTVEDNNTWTIPTSWEDCSIYVYGEENTHFNLIEHPLKS